MFAMIMATAVAMAPASDQSGRDFAKTLEQARDLSTQLDGPSSVGMLELMQLSHKAEAVCPLGSKGIDTWTKANRLTELESYVMGALCESYWAGRYDGSHELTKDIAPQR